MYEEEEKGDQDDDELDDIIEEDHEEESEDSDGVPVQGIRRRKKRDDAHANETVEERNARIAQKEELKNLKTQMLNMKDQLAKKATKIEEIKTTLKHS